jgi:hormone-sensitive lipase
MISIITLIVSKDPLLPFGFMMRCLKAYSNADIEDTVDIKHLQELENMKRAKADRNEELKRKLSLNPECDQEMIFSDEEKSESFEEISCFERHQTDSNLQAHISAVSDVASNDTLAGASFLTGTDNKNSNINDTIEIISPIDSIRSATSLEDDSLPITIQKNEKRNSGEDFADIDLPATTSNVQSDDSQHKQKYVDEFIEKYVCDARQFSDGSIKPILRKADSRTQSEENIVFDISRDTISVQNIHAKVQRVASSLVDTVSSTITQITTSNRPIIRNYSIDDDEFRMLDNESVPMSPSNDFIFTVPKDPLLSPLFADDDALMQFPSTRIVSLTLDSFLDDNIELAKKLRDLNVDIKLDILDGLPHGFLNFSRLSKEAHDGSKLAMSRIADLLSIPLDQDETKVKYFC